MNLTHQNPVAKPDLFLAEAPPMELTADQMDLLRGFASAEKVVWDIWDDYFYRYDTHQRCTAEAYKLLDAGLVDKPVMGLGRFCTVTTLGKAVLLAAAH